MITVCLIVSMLGVYTFNYILVSRHVASLSFFSGGEANFVGGEKNKFIG